MTALRFINEFELFSLERTQTIAKQLALCLVPPDTLFLKGSLGSGKTTFARFVIQALMNQEIVVQSPTFPLILTYDTPRGDLWHVDLYRLETHETRSLGLEEQWKNGMTLIEWPERLENKPGQVLELHFSLNRHRKLSFFGDNQWSKRLEGIA